MNILFIADLHDINYENLDKIKLFNYDVCILLGDISKKGLLYIKSIVNKQIYGITGNHDTFELLKQSDIEDINLKTIDVGSIKVAGLSGGVKYKAGMYAMLTQEQMKNNVKLLDKCDILISHETGYHYIETDKAHEGFIAIDQYIQSFSPKYNIFGHYHKNLNFQKYNTNCICIYQCALFNYDLGNISIIF